MADYITSDTHADAEGLEFALQSIGFNVDTDMLTIAGDIPDRGPTLVRLMDLILKYGWRAVKGNHCDKYARYAKGNKIKMNAELADSIRQSGDRVQEFGAWFDALPLYLPFEDEQGKGFIVHAGVAPPNEQTGKGSTIETQDKTNLLRIRTWPFTKLVIGQEPEAPSWQDSYKGHLGQIIHGHHFQPTIQAHGNPFVWSMDGGAVFGGVHRIMRFGDRRVFETPASAAAIAHYQNEIKAHWHEYE